MEYRPTSNPGLSDDIPSDVRPKSTTPALVERFMWKRAINQWRPPKYAIFSSFTARLQTFENWPYDNPKPESLSKAGFIYEGK